MIGLTISVLLSESGLKVCILEKGICGSESSWAGAGILSPPQCNPNSGPVEKFRSFSIRGMKAFSNDLLQKTGIYNGYYQSGSWEILDENISNQLATDAWDCEGIEWERFYPAEIKRIELNLVCTRNLVYRLPGKSQIRNPWHLKALRTRAKQLGVVIRENEPATGWIRNNSIITSVTSTFANYPCSLSILCSGCWASGLASNLGLVLPVSPVKGQMVLFKTIPGLLTSIVEQGKKYLVPRQDGRILCGSTEEHTGFSKINTSEGIQELKFWAFSLVPKLLNAEVEKIWAGLRPSSPDGSPFIGPIAEFPNILLATGHFRSGIQLSWGTAELIRQFITGSNKNFDWKPFHLSRPFGPLHKLFHN